MAKRQIFNAKENRRLWRQSIILILLIFITGCSKKDEKVSIPFKIYACLDTIIQDWEGQDVFIKAYNSLTGNDLSIIQPPHQQYMEKLLVSINGGSIPDVFESLPEYLSSFIEKDIAFDMTELVEESKNIANINPEYLDAIRNIDGKLFAFPVRRDDGCVTYIRKDWLDNLGLEIPRTWEQMVEVLRAFTFNDPDGNGTDDTFGYTDVNGGAEDWYNRVVMLDARVEIYNKDGVWIDGFQEPRFKLALLRFKQIVDEGLVDPDFLTNTTFAARTRFFNGEIGVFTYWGNHWARNFQERTQNSVGGSVIVKPIPPLESGFYIERVPPLLVVNSKTEDPQRIFKEFIENQYDKGQVQTLFTYGVENYHWKYVNGSVEFMSNPKDPYEAKFMKAFVPPSSVINDWEVPSKADALIQPARDLIDKFARKEKIMFGGEYFNEYYLEIERSLKPEIISKILTNEIGVDEGIDLYIIQSKQLYLDDILNELNEH